MSIFGDIWNKITSAVESAVPAAEAAPATPTADAGAGATPSEPAPSGSAEPTPAPASQIDVEAVLVKLAAEKGGDDNWRTSIVDLLKLLDIDSSLAGRTTLAHELDVHAGADGSAEQNLALHQAVVQKMEENGGKVPASMKA